MEKRILFGQDYNDRELRDEMYLAVPADIRENAIAIYLKKLVKQIYENLNLDEEEIVIDAIYSVALGRRDVLITADGTPVVSFRCLDWVDEDNEGYRIFNADIYCEDNDENIDEDDPVYKATIYSFLQMNEATRPDRAE